MSYEWWIAQRYLWSKRRHPFVGVVSTISIVGICVGVAALIMVLAVMNGFDEDLKSRIIGTRAHLVIEKEGVLNDHDTLIRQCRHLPLVAGAAAFVEGQALVQKGDWTTGVLVRGIDRERERSVSKFFDYVTRGTLTANPQSVVVGSEFAKRLNAGIGSQFLIVTQTTRKPLLFTVEGIFSSGMYDYDANLIFLNLKTTQDLFALKDGVSGISLYLNQPEKANQVKQTLQKSLGYPYTVRTWMDLNRTLFGALKLEKSVMFLILALIILVACLNIAGSLTILVMDKTKDIGILKALGAAPASLMKIFALDGFLIGLIGAGTGGVMGIGGCVLLERTSFIDLPKEIYYIDRLPIRVSGFDTLAILSLAVGLSLVSAFYPAWMAGKLDPVKALRYE